MQVISSKQASIPKKIAVIIAIAVALVFVVVFSFANMQLDKRTNTAEDLLANMSLHDKICQMMVVYRADAVQEDNITYNLDENPYGGIIYYSPDIDAAGDVRQMLCDDQAASRIPLFTVVDEEGGDVSRLAGNLASHSNWGRPVPYEGCEQFFPMLYYQYDGEQTAYDHAVTIGGYLSEYGFNWNLAPVADIADGPSGEDAYVYDRCYSMDFEQGSSLVSAAVEGYKSTGVMTCLKHFPGHGSVEGDSHYGEVRSQKEIEMLENEDILPFKGGIDAGTDSLMLGHIIVPAVDERPASTSSIWCSYIRNELGFNGLIVTDGMAMKGADGEQTVITGTPEELAAQSISAGVDVILTPEEPDELVKCLEEMVISGELDETKIDEAVKRILSKKFEKGIM